MIGFGRLDKVHILVKVLMWGLQFVSLYFFVFWMLTFLDKDHLFKREKISTILKTFPTVAIIIPAYNEGNTIKNTIKSVINLDYPKDKLTVFVVNDGSTDNTLKCIREVSKNQKNIEVISHKNMGKAASINSVLKDLKTDYFACLDADSFVDNLTLKKQISLFHKLNNSNVAIVTPAMKVFKPKNLLQKMQRIEYITVMFFARMMSRLNVLFVAPGPFSLYKTRIIQKVGGFDTASLTEDQEIVYRLQKKHYQIKQCFNGYVFTVAPNKVRNFINQRRRWFKGGFMCVFNNKGLVLNKNYGDFGLLQLPLNLFSFVLAFSVLVFTAYFTLKPLYHLLKNLAALNFNIPQYISTLSFSFNILDFRFGAILILYLAFLLILSMLFFSHKNANEKLFSHGFFSLLAYLFFYNIFISFICILAVFELLLGVKQKW